MYNNLWTRAHKENLFRYAHPNIKPKLHLLFNAGLSISISLSSPPFCRFFFISSLSCVLSLPLSLRFLRSLQTLALSPDAKLHLSISSFLFLLPIDFKVVARLCVVSDHHLETLLGLLLSYCFIVLQDGAEVLASGMIGLAVEEVALIVLML